MAISPYLIVFALLLIGFLLTRVIPSSNNAVFNVLLIVLTIFLALRYGQGTDYSMYEWFYMSAPDCIDFTNRYFSNLYHTEIGWKILMTLLKITSIPFEYFVLGISIIMMLCLYRCIRLFSPDKMLSLLIAFPTLYLVGFFSMLRQGLVVAIFLGFLLKYIIDDKHILKYVCISLILMLIHTISAIFIIALIVRKVLKFTNDRSWLFLFFGVCLVVGVLPAAISGIRSFMSQLPYIGYYYRTVSISWLAVFERLLWFAIIVPLGYRTLQRHAKDNNAVLSTLLDLYVFGISLYFLFLVSPNAASRFSFPFESMELLLVPLVFSKVKHWKNAVTLLVCVLSVVFVVKNINASIDERGYYPFVTWENYPYVSIFDNPSQLSLYREPYNHSLIP